MTNTLTLRAWHLERFWALFLTLRFISAYCIIILLFNCARLSTTSTCSRISSCSFSWIFISPTSLPSFFCITTPPYLVLWGYGNSLNSSCLFDIVVVLVLDFLTLVTLFSSYLVIATILPLVLVLVWLCLFFWNVWTFALRFDLLLSWSSPTSWIRIYFCTFHPDLLGPFILLGLLISKLHWLVLLHVLKVCPSILKYGCFDPFSYMTHCVYTLISWSPTLVLLMHSPQLKPTQKKLFL